jgi:hypothetical protein
VNTDQIFQGLLKRSSVSQKILIFDSTKFTPLIDYGWNSKPYEDEDARKVLDDARKTLPTSHENWIAILRLDEKGNEGGLDGLMDRGMRRLGESGGMPSREMD